MENAGWLLLAGLAFCVYAAVLLATVGGAVRAFRERYLPPWVVGLAAAVLIALINQWLRTPLGWWGDFLAIPGGITAGAIYGLQRRRSPRVAG